MITPERDPAALATASCLQEGDRFVWDDRVWFVDELNGRFAHVKLVDMDEAEWHESGRRQIGRSTLCHRLDEPGSGVVSLTGEHEK